MIKTILWDFDGVILDSMKIKGDGFVELFHGYDKKYLQQIEKYHYENGGVSRFDKIRYFYTDILHQDISEDEIVKLADKFARIIKMKLSNKENLIMETIEFIKANYKEYNFHIVSGAENRELNDLCKQFEITCYFLSINGSPTKKDILIANIMEKYNYKTDETILIGDAITDYNAAKKNKINFYGYNNSELKQYGNYIDTFLEFKL
ncbi:HAD-IA family hydrolase [Sulfurimonas sp. NWX367]|uniref:HAD family hydrolase n=1 Tax=unclassified Sulfurimonas TaxID=2623549 RepID=UPI0032047CDA